MVGNTVEQVRILNLVASGLALNDLALNIPPGSGSTFDITGMFSTEIIRRSNDFLSSVQGGLATFQVEFEDGTTTNYSSTATLAILAGADLQAANVFITRLSEVIDLNNVVKKVVVSGVALSGTVTLSGLGGVEVKPSDADNNVVTISGEPLPTTSGQVIDEDLITINRARFGYGKNGNVNGAYLRVESAASIETGHVMMRPARLTGIAVFYPTGTAEKRFEVRKNADPTPLLEVVVQVGVPKIIDELSIDFDLGDRIQVFVTASGSSIKDPNFWGEVGWRAV